MQSAGGAADLRSACIITSSTLIGNMKIPPLTRDQVRRVDAIAIRDYGMSGLVLMENAGRGAAETIGRVAPDGRVVIVCGKGNNGGDGYVIARHLQLAGRDVVIVSVVDRDQLSGDAAANAAIAVKAEIPIETFAGDGLRNAEVIVDCLLGTGAVGDPRGDYASLIELANSTDSLRIAIDIPSGLDCDSGLPATPTFRADHTITFVASKVGFEKATAKDHVGLLHEVGIGVPKTLLAKFQNPSAAT